MVVQVVQVAVAVAVAEMPRTMLEALEVVVVLQSTIKMYAVLFEKQVVSYAVLTEEELKIEKLEYPDNEFIEMTLENSPATYGMFWNGKKFTSKEFSYA
jgi:hypothetical protein